jgi:RimJ/RimL family protein N-acetyltransferase
MATGPQVSNVSSTLEQQRQMGFNGSLPEDAMHVGGPLTLLNGCKVHVRAIRPDDCARLRAFHARLSPETIHLRYFAMMAALSEAEALHVACVDYERRMAVVTTTVSDGEEQVIALAGYEPAGFATAEVAFVVEDSWQGQGIATHLLYVLAAYARRHGIVTFIATVMPLNARMLGVLHHCGFPYVEYRTDCTEVRLDISVDVEVLPVLR